LYSIQRFTAWPLQAGQAKYSVLTALYMNPFFIDRNNLTWLGRSIWLV